MKEVVNLLRKTRRLWMLEHFLRGALLAIGLALNAALICLLLHRLMSLPTSSIYAVIALAAAALASLAIAARARTPSARQMARLLDHRAGTTDLFASALEFHDQPERFGWLGELTWRKAVADAESVSLQSRWSVGRLRNWCLLAGLAASLLVAILIVNSLQARKPSGSITVAIEKTVSPVVAQAMPPQPIAPAEKPAPQETLPPLADATTQPADKSEDNTVKITSDMIEKYVQQMPGQEEVDLTGVTPIRWDANEQNGKANPQEQQHEEEKIDPVKLDASMLKDLQTAKKTKEEGGENKEGGVDIAVMSQNQGDLKAKGNEGGKGNKESLADAVSKDPRGEASRMAVKPARKALPLRSSERLPTREKTEDRPMNLLEFMSALERTKQLPREPDAGPPRNVDPPDDHLVRQENVKEGDADLTESYFDILRKADR